MCLEAKKVILDTLMMPHLLWHDNEETYRAKCSPILMLTSTLSTTSFWVLYTSEREPHVQVDRSLLYSQLAWEILTPKGYKMINAFDVTEAFAFDTTGQLDGMHVIGPPIQSIITKLFHHICVE
jgi:hypothetical protein